MHTITVKKQRRPLTLYADKSVVLLGDVRISQRSTADKIIVFMSGEAWDACLFMSVQLTLCV